jgi:hypothetical protein
MVWSYRGGVCAGIPFLKSIVTVGCSDGAWSRTSVGMLTTQLWRTRFSVHLQTNKLLLVKATRSRLSTNPSVAADQEVLLTTLIMKSAPVRVSFL